MVASAVGVGLGLMGQHADRKAQSQANAANLAQQKMAMALQEKFQGTRAGHISDAFAGLFESMKGQEKSALGDIEADNTIIDKQRASQGVMQQSNLAQMAGANQKSMALSSVYADPSIPMIQTTPQSSGLGGVGGLIGGSGDIGKFFSGLFSK